MCETNSASDVLEHCGCQIRLSQSGLEWMAFVALLKQSGLDHGAGSSCRNRQGHEYIEHQPASDKSSP
jgi:hypothetical protein